MKFEHWGCMHKPKEKKSWNEGMKNNSDVSQELSIEIREVKCFKKWEKRCEMKAGIMLHIVTSQDFQNSQSIHKFYGSQNILRGQITNFYIICKKFWSNHFYIWCFRCSIPVKSWTKMQELILQSSCLIGHSSFHKYPY